VPLGAVPVLSWCGEVSLGGVLIITGDDPTKGRGRGGPAGPRPGSPYKKLQCTILHGVWHKGGGGVDGGSYFRQSG